MVVVVEDKFLQVVEGEEGALLYQEVEAVEEEEGSYQGEVAAEEGHF